MAECSFCGAQIKKGSGKMYVRDNGSILYFDKSKCEKNMLKLGRDARKFKWTKFFEKKAVPVAKEKLGKAIKEKKAATPAKKTEVVKAPATKKAAAKKSE